MVRLKPQGGRLAVLDGLRAVSIGLVLLGHASDTQNFPRHHLSAWIGDYANLGVIVFFVISGYLITRLLMEEHERFHSISLRLFYGRRFLRLAPALLSFLAAMTAVHWLGWITLGPADFWSAFTYTVNFRSHPSWFIGHLWSLSVEEQFYVLWPAVLVLAGIPRSIPVAVGVLLMSPAARLWAIETHVPGAIFPCVADSLAAGCLLALIGDRLLSRQWYAKLITSPWFLPAAGIAILFANYSRYYFLGMLFGVSVINIVVAVLVQSVVTAQPRVAALLSTPPLVATGILSYSLYLWQQPFLNSHSPSVLCAFPQNIVLALCAASLSYVGVERPLNALRKKLRRVSIASPAAPGAVRLPQACLVKVKS